jgi:phosphopantothenoylcysteine decarboxylase/phosphopantothenate--cysteine ligase
VGILADKRIVLGVSGSIACYKVVDLARQLTVEGALVDVVMTEEATRFVTPFTFQSLTYRPVYTDMWSTLENAAAHVKLGEEADAVIIAPATAHTIAGMVAGLADTILLTTVLATRAPVLVAPAMNVNMWHNQATQNNVAVLQQRGIQVIEPDEGMLASGIIGRGRLPAVDRLADEIQALLGRHYGRMVGRKVVITAGGTHEPLDPVRYIGNRSSGQMGYALAEAARDEGAHVVLISGPTALAQPAAIEAVNVETAQEMHDAVHSTVDDADLLIMNAAVADYRPVQAAAQKLKKSKVGRQIELEPTVDILTSISHLTRPIKIGFAAETENLLVYATDKLQRKNLDMIVANNAVDSIGKSDVQVTLIEQNGRATSLPRLPKTVAATQILEHVIEWWPDRIGWATPLA